MVVRWNECPFKSGIVKITPSLFVVGWLYVSPLLAADLLLQENADTLTILAPTGPVLTYHKTEVPPPPGESALYRRSGFIHPLHAPNGDVVTSIHAPDHVHHMGVWHAWVKTKWNGRALDFWNLKAGQATVRFVDVVDRKEAGEAVGFAVRQQQVALADGDFPETVILEEILDVTAAQQEGVNLIDYTVTQSNASDHPLELPAYRYGGGIAYRAPDGWGESRNAYLTSKGLDRTEGHATRAEWVAMHGPTESGESTVVIMSHPSNHDSPQRVRIWEKGKVFFNYVPAQEHAWQIEPGETITLRYRLLVFDRAVEPELVQSYWRLYAGQ